jgi:hypothetical protein
LFVKAISVGAKSVDEASVQLKRIPSSVRRFYNARVSSDKSETGFFRLKGGEMKKF